MNKTREAIIVNGVPKFLSTGNFEEQAAEIIQASENLGMGTPKISRKNLTPEELLAAGLIAGITMLEKD